MTKLVDSFFIKIGLDEDEIEETTIRGMLYFGMIFLLGFSAAFLIMALIG